jgi:hypothetical protein
LRSPTAFLLLTTMMRLLVNLGHPSGSRATEEYQVTMLRSIRDVNLDHLVVGWYQVVSLSLLCLTLQSANMGSFLTEDFVLTQFEYQDDIPEAVVLVYGTPRALFADARSLPHVTRGAVFEGVPSF